MTNAKNQGCLSSIFRFLKISPKEKAPEALPYSLKDNFLSPAELSFFHVLTNIVQGHLVVCPKVRLSDIFSVSHSNKNLSYLSRISQKHVDFLLCDPKTMQPQVGLELDDKSHQKAKQIKRDEFVEQVFAIAKLPLRRFSVKRNYDTHNIAKSLQAYLPAKPENAAEIRKTNAKEFSNITPPSNCPRCNAPMVLRTIKRGEHKGKQFYGCSTFPQCRGVLPYTEKTKTEN